ncbi:MAG TPA: MoxR family ATPase [Thermoanaerobaculia bacterium]|nr:MoxR family ATPase [Thermoanaerobaculia bacterium]
MTSLSPPGSPLPPPLETAAAGGGAALPTRGAAPAPGTAAVPELPAARLAAAAGELVAAVERQVLGQREAVELLLAAYMAGGHVLLQGLPGLGKTRLARVFAQCLGERFCRVQFTPDLMPADLVGTNVFDAGAAAFRLLRGPVFTDVLMADEINRTPPKTQSALLEAMQERQVTIDGESHPLGEAFFVVATQNPIELEGVYPLPEAQLDRFLVRIEMGLPSRDAELQLLRQAVTGGLDDAPAAAVLGPGEALALRFAARRVHAGEELLDYLARLAAAARRSPQIELGVSPRAVLALLAAARGAALLEGRDFAAPDDVKRLLVPCWAHRLILTPEAELEGHTARQLLEQVAAAEPVPH